MVLRGDLDLAGGLVEYGMIRAVMTERQLERPCTEGEPQDLMAEADAEHRLAARAQLLGRGDAVSHGRRISGSVRQEEPVGTERDRFLPGCRRRDDGHASTHVAE